MRLWHYKMISALPRKQLISQLRECVQIGKALKEKGTPNHIIVNRVIPFFPNDYAKYCKLLVDEIRSRNYNVSTSTIEKLNSCCSCYIEQLSNIKLDAEIFPGFHNKRYGIQCYYNLQEKYDDGIVPESEWKNVENWFANFLSTSAN